MGRDAARAELEALFAAALAAVDVRRAVREAAATLPTDRPWVVIAIGKAAAAMAGALEGVAGPRLRAGLVVTKHGHGLPLATLAVREAGHPVPDRGSLDAGAAVLACARASRPEDLLVVLLSGGASALAVAPRPGLTLDDLARTGQLLLGCGASIDEMNAVRKHLSGLAGGGLAREARAGRVVLLAVSDVPGDRLDVIGSGPCCGDPTRFRDALDVVERHAIGAELPRAVVGLLRAGAEGRLPETLAPGAPELDRVESRILLRNADALAGAAREARARGLAVREAPSRLAGEARALAAALVEEARTFAHTCRARSAVLVAGGETTVRLRGSGTGGRNQELALAAALALDGSEDVSVLAAGTDGTDGPTDAAGAFADGATRARAAARGADAVAALAENDAYHFFAREGGLLRTGPTHTNVMDVALVRVTL